MSSEKPSNLPLNDLSKPARLGLMTPQMAVQQAMAAMNARAQQLTGVTLPKYYNPAAVNPLKYAEQMQKRKLLWQSAPKKEVRLIDGERPLEILHGFCKKNSLIVIVYLRCLRRPQTTGSARPLRRTRMGKWRQSSRN